MMSMWWRAGFLSLSSVLAVGCTKLNPSSCESGVCSDPALPYCDVTGAVSGTPKACIAVACTASAFQTCDGDTAITCNATGDNYDNTHCDLGCEPGIGCRVCQPSQTVCANGTVQTCDASGAVTASQTCPLGCFENQPRCRDIDPSNGLAQYLDMVANPPDLDLSAGGKITTDDGAVFDAGNSPIPVPSFLIPAPTGGVPVRVLVVRTAHLGSVSFGPSGFSQPSTALAIVAASDITIVGRITGDGGAVNSQSCNGGPPIFGGGGGGFATAGGAGGALSGPSGNGGSVSGNSLLVPLRGGCGSGAENALCASGGGAIQLASRTSIRLAAHASINLNGEPGFGDVHTPGRPCGSGAGGGILLEAPSIDLADDSRLLTNGGPGAAGNNVGQLTPGSDTLAPAPGGVCDPPDPMCGAGGAGAGVGSPAQNGKSGNPDATSLYGGCGGGGGGLGRIRINTRDGAYNKLSTVIEAGDLTSGVISTR